ncbi:hypothetical protein D3C72_1429220 [compost metagenome]
MRSASMSRQGGTSQRSGAQAASSTGRSVGNWPASWLRARYATCAVAAMASTTAATCQT